MKLITKAIEKALEKQGDTSQMSMEKIMVIAKFFNPVGPQTWYLYDWDRDTRGRDGDTDEFPPRTDNLPNRLWVFANLGDPSFAECGTVLLSELENIKLRGGLRIERDIHFSPMPLSEVIRTIKEGRHI